MSIPSFHDEAEWMPTLEALPPFPVPDAAQACVVAAHPDDETLGAAGLLHRLHARGCRIRLVVATDGEAAFPDAGRGTRQALARRRRAELVESLRVQGIEDIETVWLGLPDAHLAAHLDELTLTLADLGRDADLCLAPWPGDPHPDHQAAGTAMLAAAPAGAHRWSYPIWLWHWISPEDPAPPWPRAAALALDPAEQATKEKAIHAFSSQLHPGPAGEDPILPPEVLGHFARDREVFFREPVTGSTPLRRFEDLYRGQADPWAVDSAWYEQRKRAVALACLPAARYGTAVEPACGTGALTAELASRCDDIQAFDAVPAAVAKARVRLAGMSTVDVRIGQLPADLHGPADLVVLSEILYYLGAVDLDDTVTAAVSALRPGGHLLAVHWLPWAPDAPRDGRAAHRRLRADPRLTSLVTHEDEAFLVHVLARR